MSRTTTVKNFDELHFYAVGEDPTGQLFATLIVTDATTLEIREGPNYNSAAVDSLLIISENGIAHGLENGPTLQIGSGESDTVEFSAGDRPNAAHMKTPTGGAGVYFSVTNGTAGQKFKVYTVPSYTINNEVDFIQSFDHSPPPQKRAIMQRGEVKHRKRVFNRERSISLAFLYTNAVDGLAQFAGNPFTLIAERHDDDNGIATETTFIFGCQYEAPMPSGSIGDNDDEVKVDGSYEEWGVIADDTAESSE